MTVARSLFKVCTSKLSLPSFLTTIQSLEDLSSTYEQLRVLILGLIDELDTLQSAGRVFSSPLVCKRLEDFLSIIIEAAQKIAECYSKSKTGVYSPRLEHPLEAE